MIKLQEIRKKQGISQQNLADKMGVSRSTIAMWETGGSQPDNISLQKLADYFNVSVDYLLGRTNEKNPGAEPELDGIDFALSGEIHELTDGEKQDILDYIRFKKKQKNVAHRTTDEG